MLFLDSRPDILQKRVAELEAVVQEKNSAPKEGEERERLREEEGERLREEEGERPTEEEGEGRNQHRTEEKQQESAEESRKALKSGELQTHTLTHRPALPPPELSRARQEAFDLFRRDSPLMAPVTQHKTALRAR